MPRSLRVRCAQVQSCCTVSPKSSLEKIERFWQKRNCCGRAGSRLSFSRIPLASALWQILFEQILARGMKISERIQRCDETSLWNTPVPGVEVARSLETASEAFLRQNRYRARLRIAGH